MLPAPPARRARPAALALALAVTLPAALTVGCGHTEPFATQAPGTSAPFAETEPTQLTYNLQADLSPAWLSAGDAFIYSYVAPERTQGDRCLGRLAPTGGTLRDILCPVARRDSTLLFDQPAVSAEGRLAFLRASRARFITEDQRREVYVGPDLQPGTAARLRPLPLVGPAGQQYNTIWSLRWLDATRLVFVAANDRSIVVDPAEDPIKLTVGLDIAIMDASDPAAPLQLLDGVTHPTSVAPGESPGLVYYTVAGDTRVFRRVLAEGAATVAHDFGPLGIPRDVHVAGGRLTAVVGGLVRVIDDPSNGRVQDDRAGHLYVVDLATGTEQRLGATRPDVTDSREFPLYRHPVLSPDGKRVVAEGLVAQVVLVSPPPAVVRDTVIARGGDLWGVGAP
jgi:hypothetical protein